MDRAWISACRRIEVFFVLHALFCSLILVSGGANRTPELNLGYWFGWSPLVLVVFLVPYVTTYDDDESMAQDNNVPLPNDYIVKISVASIWIRYHVQLLLSALITVCYATFFAFRLAELLADCGTGTQCDLETTSYVLYCACAFIMFVCGLGVFLVLFTCPVVSPHVSIPRASTTSSSATQQQTSNLHQTQVPWNQRNAVARAYLS